MFFGVFKKLCAEKGITPTRASVEIGFSKGSVSYWRKKHSEGVDAKPDTYTAQKIADFFGVSVDYLLGRTDDPAGSGDADDKEKAPAVSGQRPISDDEIKFALFGGEGEISDAMLDEVRSFAAFVKRREEEKGKKE